MTVLLADTARDFPDCSQEARFWITDNYTLPGLGSWRVEAGSASRPRERKTCDQSNAEWSSGVASVGCCSCTLRHGNLQLELGGSHYCASAPATPPSGPYLQGDAGYFFLACSGLTQPWFAFPSDVSESWARGYSGLCVETSLDCTLFFSNQIETNLKVPLSLMSRHTLQQQD